MDKIIGICKKKILIIEDAAEVIGLKYKNRYCGSFGDISTFSFYSNKQLTTGEGGMISTNNQKFYKKFKALRNLCFGSKQRFNHEDIGWNYRITNMQAALGINQLKRLDLVVKKKNVYRKLLLQKIIAEYKHLYDSTKSFLFKEYLLGCRNCH